MNAEIIPGYKIFTDATADFPAGMAAGMPRVEIIPMEVTAGSDSFLYGPGGNLTVAQFYAMQRGGKFATTSQINPAAYVQFFESALKEGFDVLYLCFSSGMSGCFGNARLCMDDLREAYPDRKLICLDTLAASAGEALLVAEAARRQQEGMMLGDLAAWVEAHRLQACHWFPVDCFDHLRHGGRISAAATVGSVLNTKPLLQVDAEGILGVVKKPRAGKIIQYVRRIRSIFVSFIFGQVLEAFILGSMVFAGTAIFRFPHACPSARWSCRWRLCPLPARGCPPSSARSSFWRRKGSERRWALSC